MKNLLEAVCLVDENLKKLMQKYNFLKEENELLYKKLAEMERKITLEKQLNNDLSNKYELLKIAKTIEGSKENKKETKLKINALVREIDLCIAQLNEKVL